MVRLWTSIDIRWRLMAAALVAVLVLPLAWYLGSPLFINVTVDERFPGVAPLSAANNLPAAGTAPTSGMASTSGPGLKAAPVALGSGQFTEVDTIHKGQGAATLYRLPDDRHLLRFEAFKVQNGPDLYVYLSGHPVPRSSVELHEQGAFEVARLKGNIGDQNYDIPAELDLNRYRAVSIWCRRFSVNFGAAPLGPAS